MRRRGRKRHSGYGNKRSAAWLLPAVISAVCLVAVAVSTIFCIRSFSELSEKEKQITMLTKEADEAKSQMKKLQKQAKDAEEEARAYQQAQKEKEEQEAKKKAAEGKRKVYLTFDDGPTERTPEILDVLKQYDVKATFFTLAFENQKEMYKRIVDEGHTLAMHSYTHKYDQIYSSMSAFKKDVTRMHDFLKEVTGVDCNIYRFPGGSSNAVSDVDMKDCMKWINSKGYRYFDWNAMTGDAEGKGYTAKQMVNNVVENMKDCGDTVVVLMHDGVDKQTTVEALPKLIQKLQDMDCVLLPIDEDTELVQHVSVK